MISSAVMIDNCHLSSQCHTFAGKQDRNIEEEHNFLQWNNNNNN